MASSSSAAAAAAAASIPTEEWLDSFSSGENSEKHDVFINFRGKDTRDSFTSHLYGALLRKNVETYRDTEELETGGEIAPALLKAIELSKIAVIIFSENYADSHWCLDELAHILECKKMDNRFIIPIFYKVQPSDVRHQIKSYATAFKKVMDRRDKVEKWKAALETAGNLSGLESTVVGDDSVLVERVVQKVLAILNRDGTCDLTGLVGMEHRIREIESILCINPEEDHVRFVGIVGMGGIGKTTLADAVYHQFSPQYNRCCFLANVREESERHGLNHLRNKLLCKLLEDDNLSIGTTTTHTSVKVKLRRLKKVLVVLDDVKDSSQLEFLAGDQVQFGKGSRIIITTRDMQPLRTRDMHLQKKGANDDINIYEVEKLKSDEALELFHTHASCRGTWSDSADYRELSERVVSSSNGVPLAIKIWGSLFLHCKSKDEFESVFHRLEKYPNQRIHNVYKVSYDGLEENEKEIFLDIACFHNGEEIIAAKRKLNASGFFVERGIGVLIDMFLVEIKNNRLWMHDLIQQMGREIVREQNTEEPGRRSRLYIPEDVRHVLEEITGSGRIRSISLNSSIASGINLTAQAFRKMHNLRYLHFGHLFKECNLPLHNLDSIPNSLRYMYWLGYPFNSLPSKFYPHNLVEIHMPNSNLKTLWNEGQAPSCLKRINLSYSAKLVEVPYLSNSLESINLNGCTSLSQVPDLSRSVYIRSIYLQGCTSLVQVPTYFQSLHSLTCLNLGSCSRLRNLPEMPHNLEFLDLDWTGLTDLPLSIWSLEKLVRLNLNSCPGINDLPSNIWKMTSLKFLDLAKTRIRELPSSIQFLTGVVSLELKDCTNIVSLPTEICKLKFIKKLSLSRCCNFRNFPEIREPMAGLEFLGLSHTDIEALPASVENLVGLKTLVLSGCRSLEFLPKSIYGLELLEKIKLDGCCRLKELPPVKYTSILYE